MANPQAKKKEHRFNPVTGEIESALYKITNTVNNKSYWGISIHPVCRWEDHKNLCLSKPSLLPKFYASLRKYGADKFEHTIVCWCRSAKIAGDLEVIAINLGLAELNTNPGGTLGPLGRKMSQESSEKKRAALKGKKKPPGTGEKISKSKKGVKFTAEHREAMSKARTGYRGTHIIPHTEEAKRKMSDRKKGKPTGPCSELRRKAISDARQLGIARRKLVGLLVSLSKSK